MKLIVAGASGYVASEVIRQALLSSAITSVVALARTQVFAPQGPDNSKFKSVVIQDYGFYPDEAKIDLKGADACIWTIGVTPMKAPSMDFAEVKRICVDCTVYGVKTLSDLRAADPFRFLYMSGNDAERDQTKSPQFMPEYFLMRGEAESRAMDAAKQRKGELEVGIVRPGMITDGLPHKDDEKFGTNAAKRIPNIPVQVVARAMLKQIVQGFEIETIGNEDLKRIGT